MKQSKLIFILLLFFFTVNKAIAQTSWKGTYSTSWKSTSNWTNGIPTANVDAIIGDANFTGTYHPTVSSSGTCRNIQIGGLRASTLTVSKNFTITGNLTNNSNGSITQNKSTITIQGNWNNGGNYTANNSNAIVSFGGVSQTLGGNATVFRKLKINAGSTVTLATNISTSGSQNYLYVYGTLNPGQSPTYMVTAASIFNVYSAGVLKVNAATLTANYTPTISLYVGSTVDYSSTTVNQTINSRTYSTLKISGSTVKSLAANLPSLNAASSADGNIFVVSGTLDLATYTASRGTSVAGGNFSISNGAFLKIGGTNAFPANYATNTMSLTSTTEYNGANQVVTSATYGNLRLSSSGGVASKTTGTTNFTVAGHLITQIGAGSGVNLIASANIAISGNDSIGISTTFSGGAYAHSIAGNLVNNGTLSGGTSTITMTGAGTTISGTGTYSFYNLNINASNIIASASSVSVNGNIATNGSGTFTHSDNSTLVMSGTGKAISGAGIFLSNITISGTVSTTSNITITGNMTVAGSFTATASNITMTGTSKTITNAGTLVFYGLLIPGTITTTTAFSVSSALDVSGSFSAVSGTATFTGSATLNGIVNLYNVTLNCTSLLLSTNAVLGISNVFIITAGLLDVNTAIPNTVCFNGSGAQTLPSATYYRLTLSTGGTKTAAGSITTKGIFTVDAGVTLDAANYTHTLESNFVNNGSFTPASGTMAFTGSKDVTISGATIFNQLTINKTSAANVVSLLSNARASTLNMTNGELKTGSNTITITGTRTGNGIIMGNIDRTHTFTTGIAYAFESPDNTISFASVSSVSSVKVSVSQVSVADFPYGSAANRLYDITVPSGTYNATLRLHYLDAELNGNTESSMVMWNYNGSAWMSIGKSANSTTSNYIEQSGLTNITNRWTFAGLPAVFRWNGSASSNWTTAANWTLIQGTGTVPGLNDVAQIGQQSITNQPIISSAVTIKNIEFGSVAAGTLTLAAGGSLYTAGNISGTWAGAATHTINAGAQSLTVAGSLLLSDGVTGHDINLSASTASITIGESLVESGGANVTFTSAAALYIGESFIYTSGTFTPGSSNVYYNGSSAQIVGGVNYYNLSITKPGGIASIDQPLGVSGIMDVNSGELDLNANTTVTGNLVVGSGATISFDEVTMSIGGDLSNSGNFIPGSGTISFIGAGSQLISLATFNNIIINKPLGAISFTGNIDVYGNFTILAGNIALGSYTANRTSLGGVFSLASGASLSLSGTNNFPSNYSNNVLENNSTVTYNGTGVQTVNAIPYGHLVLSNGGANAKTLAGHISVSGDITINSNATLNTGPHNLSLNGNWTNSGTLIPVTGTVLLNGANKNLTGATTFNKLTVYGSYTVTGSDIVYNGLVNITAGASLDGGSGLGTVHGDLINSGTLISTGTTTFSGMTVQTIRLLSPIQSNANGIINFNGTVAPVLNSTATPQFATVNINNTGGVSASVNWVVGYGFNVSTGSTFNGGVSTHYFYGSFVNNGTVTSSGTLNFLPSTAQTYTLGGTAFTSTGTVSFGGTGAITVVGTPTAINDVIIANTSGVTPGTNWLVSRNFTVNSNAVFNAGNYSYTIGGDLESNGTLNGGTSTFTMNGAAVEISGSPNTTFYNFVVDGNVTANVNFNVSNNFSNNNVFDATIGNLVMTGSGPGIIGGSAAIYTLAQLDIAKTGSGTATLARNLVDVLNIDVISGTLNGATYSITQDAGGGALFIRDNATLKIGGTNAMPTFASYELDTLSTVEYNGAAQTISSLSAAGSNYGNLIISTSGNKTANGSLNIFHDFTLTNGSFVSGNYTDTLLGNWTMTSGSLNSTGTTLTLYHTGIQTISSTGSFNNIIVNKTAGSTTLSSNITAGGTITFAAGKITTGSNTLILSSTAGTVSGASQANGWVDGKLQKVIPTGATNRIFEIGDGTIYSPATVAFASVSLAGNVTAAVAGIEHLDIVNSGVDGSKNVNRHFTITNAGTVFTNATITLNWVTADMDAGATTALFKVNRYSGGTWTLLTTASPLTTSAQATGVTAFGDFVIGERVSATSWTGAISTNWNTATNWSAGVPTASTSIFVPGSLSNYPLVSTGTVSVLNVTINTGATITIAGAVMEVGGSITNSGTIIATNGSFKLNGIVAQTIPAGLFQTNTLKDLAISNSAGVTLGGALGLTDVFTLTDGQFTTGGYLTLKSTAAGTARVAPVTNGTVSGNVTVERYITNRRAWRLLTLPLAHAGSIYNYWQNGGVYQSGKGTFVTGAGADPAVNGMDVSTYSNYSLKSFITATQAFQPVTNTYTTNLSGNSKDSSDNIGYLMFVRGDRNPANLYISSSSATTLIGSGKLQYGPQYFTAAATAGKYTLIGNPYASPIDFSLLAKTNLVNRFMIWDPSLNDVGGYVTVDDAANTGTYTVSPTSSQTKELQSGQAFFVLTQATAAASLGIAETNKSVTNNTVIFRPVTPTAFLRTDLYLKAANGSTLLADGVVAEFRDDFSNSIDFMDADKFNNVNETLGLLRDGSLLSIERRKMTMAADTLFLKFTKSTQRNYQFSFTAQNINAPGLTAHLQDNYTHIARPISLTQATHIDFTINSDAASQANDRFKIIFTPVATLPVTYTSVKATEKDKMVLVEWKVANEVNIKAYRVQGSTDGINFTGLNETKPLGSNTASYNWLDENPVTGVTSFYRIQNTDNDGSNHYSNIVKVTPSRRQADVVIYPNPVVNNVIGITITNAEKGIYHFRLLNIAGQQLYAWQSIYNTAIVLKIQQRLSKLSRGAYQLEVMDGLKQISVVQVQVQ